MNVWCWDLTFGFIRLLVFCPCHNNVANCQMLGGAFSVTAWRPNLRLCCTHLKR